MAGDFREMFDLRRLDSRQLGMVEFVLSSPAYIDTFEPYLRSVRESMNKMILDRTQKRKDEYPDEFLVGGIVMIDGLLKFFALILIEINEERVQDAMSSMTPDRFYEEQRQRGAVRPVVGIDQQPEPDAYRPEEDY